MLVVLCCLLRSASLGFPIAKSSYSHQGGSASLFAQSANKAAVRLMLGVEERFLSPSDISRRWQTPLRHTICSLLLPTIHLLRRLPLLCVEKLAKEGAVSASLSKFGQVWASLIFFGWRFGWIGCLCFHCPGRSCAISFINHCRRAALQQPETLDFLDVVLANSYEWLIPHVVAGS